MCSRESFAHDVTSRQETFDMARPTGEEKKLSGPGCCMDSASGH